jgi:ABC-type thiamine transport system ATPase subunit
MARIDELTRELVQLPQEQRLALARVLLEVNPPGNVAEAEQSWDDEIRARVIAVDEGRVIGISNETLRREMNSRYGV